MFHYRPLAINSRSRMLIAVFLAVVLHMGLMNFEFDPEPVLAPIVTLPRSVSVFLRQRNMDKAPLKQAEEAQTVEHLFEAKPKAEIEPAKSVLKKVSPLIKKTDMPLQQPSLLEETVKQPAVEKIMPAALGAEDIEIKIMSEPGEAAKVQEPATPAEPQTAQENDGATLPGTLQMAYPRYQLNDPPKYPGLARKRGQEGTVLLQVLVNRDGRVEDLQIEVSSSFSKLDRAAEAAVKKWQFEPGRKGKDRVAMWVRVPVTFKLEK